MRKTLILLTTMLLAGCVNDSASYYINGRDHALTIRRQQNYFWSDRVGVTLVAARLPDCQRLHELTEVTRADKVKGELFAADDNLWNLRLDDRLWQIDTQTCTDLTELQNDPKADLGQPVGSFEVQDGKLVFEAVPGAAPAEAPPAP